MPCKCTQIFFIEIGCHFLAVTLIRPQATTEPQKGKIQRTNGSKKKQVKRTPVLIIASACDLCIWEESMTEQGALPEPSAPTAPLKISSPSAAKNSMKSSGFLQQNPLQNAPIFPRKLACGRAWCISTERWCVFPAKKSADLLGRAPRVEVVLRESGHVDCV